MVQEPEFLKEKPKSNTPKSKLTPATIFLMVGLAVFISVMGIQLFRQNQTQPYPGDRAPNFDLVSYDGATYNLRDLRGQIVIVNLWASWCGPCHEEADDLQQIHEDYATDDVLMIGVNWLDIDSEALEFMEFYGITYPNAPDLGEAFYEAYNIQGPPETFVIGRDGIVEATIIGGTNYEALARIIDGILAEEDA
ncbi:MAG: TlpA disulfide reductase family protein [Phototrophicaceae bacterium]